MSLPLPPLPPLLPRPAARDVLLLATCYEDGAARWGGLVETAGGRREGGVVVLGTGGHVPPVALAGAGTFAEPGRPLTAVDRYDTPGHAAVLPCAMVGSTACNLEIADMDLHEFILTDGAEPWWEE